MNSYADVYFRKQIETASPERIVLMLFDGLNRNLEQSLEAIRKQQIESAHRRLIQAQNILSELAGSLNMEKGGDVARNLLSLYSYMIDQLVAANLQKSSEPVERVIRLLLPIREAWATMMGVES